MNNTFKFVGLSTLNGKIAVRYTNEKGRARVLERNGHTAIRFVELPVALDEVGAVEALSKEDFVQEDIHNAFAVGREFERLELEIA